MNTTDITVTSASHRWLWAYEWCGGATMTSVEYRVGNDNYVARLFWRTDTGTRGIELYRYDDVEGSEVPMGHLRAECVVSQVIEELFTRHIVAMMATARAIARLASIAERPLDLAA